MKIQYAGHSCFLVTADSGVRIVTDPYGDVGIPLPHLEADVVTVSHNHFDHVNAEGVSGEFKVLDRAGRHFAGGLVFTAHPCFHDSLSGRLRGKNLAFTFSVDGVRVCHMGDIGELSPALVSSLGRVDVLLLPVGGHYTVNARQAKYYADALSPSYVIPMHYKVEGLTVDIAGVEEFTSLFPMERIQHASELTLSGKQKQDTKIIVMERLA